MDFSTYLSTNGYIVSMVLFFVGLILKKTPNIKNWCIPYILSILGVLSCFVVEGFNFESVLKGLLATGVAVYVHQLGKQCIICNDSDSSDKFAH